MTARDVLTIIRQKISDAEQAGVREVPLSNLRRLIDQIEQGISGDQAKTPHGTRRGNSQKSNTGSINKTREANQQTGTRRKSIPRLILGAVVIGVAGGSLRNPQVPMSHNLAEFFVFFVIKLLLVAIGVWLVVSSLGRGKNRSRSQ